MLFTLLSILMSFQPARAEVSPPPKPGARVRLALPPIWDEATKSVQLPTGIVLKEAGTIENCTFTGGNVLVRKVEGGQVFFEPVPKVKGRCSQLETSLEKFEEMSPDNVSKEKTRREKMQGTFRNQLKEDVQGILERGADPCIPEDKELKVGSVYKVSGRVFLYGPGTSASDVEGGACQVELGSKVHVLGFNRGTDFAVAEYYPPDGSKGSVTASPGHLPAATCKPGEQIVFSLGKLKSHFQFEQPSTVEVLQAKGIAAVFNTRARVCGNDTEGRGVSSSRSRKVEPGRVDPVTGGIEDGQDPADANSAR